MKSPVRRRRPAVRMLPREALIRTSDLDQAEWNYQGVTGWISRRRASLVCDLVGAPRPGRLLEVGYGSGVFMPMWSTFADELHGIDVHQHAGDVTAALTDNGITATLHQASVTRIPYPDRVFDRVVVMSTLEFVDDTDQACNELGRVLASTGRLCVITPGYGKVTDLGLQFLTSERAEDTFQGRRQLIVPTLSRHFDVERRVTFPRFAPQGLRLYTGLLLRHH